VTLSKIIQLVVLNILLLIAGFFLLTFFNIKTRFSDVILLAIAFSVIAAVTLLIFNAGQKKEPEGQTFSSLVAVSLKFLMEMVLALIWFFIFKNKSFDSVIIFFVLYLALSLFCILSILKTLKNKAL